jgi:N-dimethylarginine dimethylaminohydrolase
MIAVVSENIKEMFEKVSKIKTYGLKPFKSLDIPVATHADMLICKIENCVFCYETYYSENKELFDVIEKSGYKIIPVKKECRKNYPGDIALNVLIMGKTLFCKKENTADEILRFAEEKGYKIINVKQGYAACSTVVLNENHAITTDKTIEKALKNENIDVIYVPTDNIKLTGYNCGFIGGASGVSDKNFFLFGSIENLNKKDEIKKILKNLNFRITEILTSDIYDFGGVKFF